MGGEVLLRPQSVHKVVYYAAQKGFYAYVPTNGRVFREERTSRLLWFRSRKQIRCCETGCEARIVTIAGEKKFILCRKYGDACMGQAGRKIVLAASDSESSEYLRSTWRQMLLATLPARFARYMGAD